MTIVFLWACTVCAFSMNRCRLFFLGFQWLAFLYICIVILGLFIICHKLFIGLAQLNMACIGTLYSNLWFGAVADNQQHNSCNDSDGRQEMDDVEGCAGEEPGVGT